MAITPHCLPTGPFNSSIYVFLSSTQALSVLCVVLSISSVAYNHGKLMFMLGLGMNTRLAAPLFNLPASLNFWGLQLGSVFKDVHHGWVVRHRIFKGGWRFGGRVTCSGREGVLTHPTPIDIPLPVVIVGCENGVGLGEMEGLDGGFGAAEYRRIQWRDPLPNNVGSWIFLQTEILNSKAHLWRNAASEEVDRDRFLSPH